MKQYIKFDLINQNNFMNPGNPKENQDDLLQDEDLSMEGYDKPVKTGRIILFIIALGQAAGIFLAPKEPGIVRTTVIASSIFVALIFIALAFWTSRKPFDAIITGLIVYSALIILNAVLDPATIINGIILKVVIYVLLISALSNAREVQRWKDSLHKQK
jgi:hypothetical protein